MQIMGIVNLTPDSFFESSRVTAESALPRIEAMIGEGADIIDLGAVSTRPGAADVDVEEEWRRLSMVLGKLPSGVEYSIDTTSAEIVRRAYETIGTFIVNDISAGEDDPLMLKTVGGLSLPYVAMHKRGNPRTMDAQCDYPEGIISELKRYFIDFEEKAESFGIKEWILDPGLGFAKSFEQNWEILYNLEDLKMAGHPVLIGAADKRFTRGDTEAAHKVAIDHGADILRVHDVKKARQTAGLE